MCKHTHVRTGGVLGDLAALDAHGQADVAVLERRRVVDPVARHRHHLALPAQLLHLQQVLLFCWIGMRVRAKENTSGSGDKVLSLRTHDVELVLGRRARKDELRLAQQRVPVGLHEAAQLPACARSTSKKTMLRKDYVHANCSLHLANPLTGSR